MLNILILILATWRLSSLLVNEPGPWEMLSRLRYRAGVRYDDAGNPYGLNELARGLVCLWCNSIWIGAGWALLYYLAPGPALWLALPLALSAGAILVNELIGRLET